jgi:glutathione S-transferase
VMNKHLKQQPFFVDHSLTVADLALYAYTHVAEQCDFDLGPFPHVRAWLERVAAEPDHITMDWQSAEVVAAE